MRSSPICHHVKVLECLKTDSVVLAKALLTLSVWLFPSCAGQRCRGIGMDCEMHICVYNTTLNFLGSML